MTTMIKDGTGSGFLAEVDSDNHLHVDAITESAIAHASHKNKAAFFAHSQYTTTSTNQRVLSLKNTSTTNLLWVDKIILPTDTNCKYIIEEVSAGTGAGTALTFTNLNLTSSNTPDADAFGGAEVTGITAATHLTHFNLLANTTFVFNFEGALLLGLNNEIAVKVAENGVATGATIFFHMRKEEV